MNDPVQEAKPVIPPEVVEGRAIAVLSYVLLFGMVPYFFLPLIWRNNEFSLYHAKQCHAIWVVMLALLVIAVPLMAICIGFIIATVTIIGVLVLCIMGIINAVHGEAKPLPIVGKWGEEWFKSVRKV
jgi:uncharacterized membrane protein